MGVPEYDEQLVGRLLQRYGPDHPEGYAARLEARVRELEGAGTTFAAAAEQAAEGGSHDLMATFYGELERFRAALRTDHQGGTEA